MMISLGKCSENYCKLQIGKLYKKEPGKILSAVWKEKQISYFFKDDDAILILDVAKNHEISSNIVMLCNNKILSWTSISNYSANQLTEIECE